MVAPESTQPPLKVMDARMQPITFLSVGKSLLRYNKSLETLRFESIMRNCYICFVLKSTDDLAEA